MNNQARSVSDYAAVTRDDWVNLGYLDNSGPNESNLPNAIHAIFNFEGDVGKSEDETLFDFNPEQSRAKFTGLLRPALRLASNLIMSPGSVQYIHWLLYSPRVDLPDVSQQRQTPVRVFRPMPVIPHHEMKREVDWALSRLAGGHLRYTFAGPVKDIMMLELRGYTLGDSLGGDGIRVRGIHSVDLLNDPSRVGISVRTQINESFITVLENLHQNPKKNAIEIFNTNFNCAKTFCHELMHALYLATEPAEMTHAINFNERFLAGEDLMEEPAEMAETVEMIFQDESASELGYSWENFVFGGRVEWDLKPHSVSRFYKWPCHLSGDLYVRGSKNKATVTEYLVPKQYLQNIHQKEFWGGVQPEHTTALRIEKSVGTRYIYPGNEPDPDWDADNSSEGAHAVSGPSGRVVREEPDPSAARANRPWNWGLRLRYARSNSPPPGADLYLAAIQ